MAKRQKLDDWLKEENLIRVQGWARDGLTMDQIAYNIGISKQTLYRWQERSSDFLDALKVSRDSADRQVENALFKNALGFKYVEQQLTDTGEVVDVEKYAKPNTTAQIFWLKNRKQEVWREKQNIEHAGGVEQKIDLSGVSDKDIEKLAKMSDEE
ncbi:helix-turn-helix domain-containing protein [Staphylococcus nepalensis]|uniref:helix-turn-helix domain-containing protein n=1 Tax=Staphylococcus nepalensis TaxID=214473 RepID=UPI000BC2E224|nr:helix-turn-helix domain-containing protein [Staphylococcus nepalensis]ATH60206.1 hypothetical protein BJD96_07765 [Staphylococcus nepalensis]